MREKQGADGSEAQESSERGLDRRGLIRLAGTVPLVSAIGATRGRAATTRHGISFDTVHTVPDEKGSNESWADAIERLADDNTLLKFPSGRYPIGRQTTVTGVSSFGIYGEGEVEFVFPQDFNESFAINMIGTSDSNILFENVDFDLTAPGATPGLTIRAADNLQVRDVEFVGQGIHPDSDPRGEGTGNPEVTNALTPQVTTSTGTGLVENFVANNKGLMGAYNGGQNGGRIGVWIGNAHKGTITLKRCHIEGFPNNGFYTSRTPGVVQIEDSYARNNDISQVRIGSDGSYVEDTDIVVTSDYSSSPNPEDAINQRGVRLECRPDYDTGPEVRDCDIYIGPTPNSEAGIKFEGNIGAGLVKNTRIQISNGDTTRGVKAPAPTDLATQPYAVTLRNVSITGSTSGARAVLIESRPNSLIENCCIKQRGDNRDGVKLIDSPDSVIRNSTIDVTGDPLVRTNSPGTYNFSTSGSCPFPMLRKFVVAGGSDDRPINYYFKSTDSLIGSDTTEDGVTSNSVVGGSAGADVDRYHFTGELLETNINYPDHDGEKIAIIIRRYEDLVEISGGTVDNPVDYQFTVSGEVTAKSSLEQGEEPSGNSASGRCFSGKDVFNYTGEIRTFEATYTSNGKTKRIEITR